MENITNVDRITRGARLGKIGTFAGLGVLGMGLVISLLLQKSSFIWVSFVCLLLGLLISSIGTFNMNRWVREPRADQALAQGLKGFDNRYRLYNYLLPAPHVLLSPMGLCVLTAMGQDGVIRFQEGKFKRDFSAVRLLRFMAEEGLGRPLDEAEAQVAALQEFLDESEVGEGVEIQNILVFYCPRVDLQVSDPPRPVVTPKAMKKALRKQQAGKIPAAQYRALQALFEDEEDEE